MELTYDRFISYSDDFTVKQEKLSDPEGSLVSSLLSDSDSVSNYPSFVSPVLRSMLDSSNLTIRESFDIDNFVSLNQRKPFRIIRVKREESADPIKIKVEPEKKVMTNARRELKREAAKKKNQKLIDQDQLWSTNSSRKSTADSFASIELEGKGSKKMQQMIRNRISAQNSRDRRRNYVQNLEQAKLNLNTENHKLFSERSRLQKEIKKLRDSNEQILKERDLLLNKGSIPCLNCQGVLNETHQCPDSDLALTINPKSAEYGSVMNLSLSLGVVLGTLIMTHLTDQKVINLNGSRDDKVQPLKKAFSTNTKSGPLSLDWEENQLDLHRNYSKSTILSPASSPLEDQLTMSSHQENDTHKLISWDDTPHSAMPRLGQHQDGSVFGAQDDKDDALSLYTFQGELSQYGRRNQSAGFKETYLMDKILGEGPFNEKIGGLERSDYL